VTAVLNIEREENEMYHSRQGRDKNATQFEIPIIIKELQKAVIIGTGHILG
jgi:hypothetical protein